MSRSVSSSTEKATGYPDGRALNGGLFSPASLLIQKDPNSNTSRAFPKPENSRGKVNRAGEILRAYAQSTEAVPIEQLDEWNWAYEVLANWRACHNYPINTFQATLRSRLKAIDKKATVAQRLKRFPSIVLNLQRFEGMQLARMQDIGGIRAILGTMSKVRRLERVYCERKFQHDLVSSKDYIAQPKTDGYRSIHLIYRYKNPKEASYNGLLLELQLRTRLQHAWATVTGDN